MKNSVIIWDFNGTILDDVQYAVDLTNDMLKRRDKEPMSVEKYRDIFTFPVFKYYELAGFDPKTKEDYQDISHDFIVNYFDKVSTCPLRARIVETLKYFSDHNVDQYILSAMENVKLNNLAKHYKIDHFFKQIVGIEDNHAGGKIHTATKLKESLGNKNIWFIGDTIHDHEVAMHLNGNSILLLDGHQSEKRLKDVENTTLISNLDELHNIIN